MKQSKRLIFYLTLNILVSACTTLAVLLAWDQLRSPTPRGVFSGALQSLSGTPTPGSELPETEAPSAAQPAPTEAFIIHQVQTGETFESIAALYNMGVEELVAVNGFTQVQPLGTGEVLRIPLHPKGSVVIDTVIGPGDLESERIQLRHRGEGELSLVGWRLEDQDGNVFIFPQAPALTLYGGGAVSVYTRSGVNSVVELYWGMDQALWHSGATITLRDAQDNVRSVYTVP